jgi:low temperature requirement protein LtrA
MSVRVAAERHPVAPLELFFDLVFVFAFTEVTTVLVDRPDRHGLLHALLILSALWWAWASYAWLTNTVDAEADAMWAAMFVAMAAMFVAALAVPDAFGAHGVLFGVAFLVVNAMHVALYALGARGDRDLLAAISRLAPTALGGSLLIVAAGFTHGPLRIVLWAAALAIGFLTPLLTGLSGWRVEPQHFVERHGLIVIIAIGESLIAIGLGARAHELDAGIVLAALLGFVVVTSFWLAYFDFFPSRARQILADRSGVERIALARDVYTYFHLPMVAGIILFAFGVRVTMSDVHAELDTVPAIGLCIGPALYLFSFILIRLSVSRTWGRGRPVATIGFALLTPVALVVPALAALALVAAVWVAFHAYELIWWREERARARAVGAT